MLDLCEPEMAQCRTKHLERRIDLAPQYKHDQTSKIVLRSDYEWSISRSGPLLQAFSVK